MAMCRNTDGCVCCWLMNVVVYNLKSLISVIKAFVCKKSYTSLKTAHACRHPLVLIIAQHHICSLPTHTAFGGTQSLFPQCINIPQCRYFVLGPYIYTSHLAKPAEFSRTAEHFSTSYIRSTSNLNPASIAS